MEKAYITQRLKKYLFLISIIFILLTSVHLISSYIYSDAKETAVKGGSISEALIGSVPNLNPLKNNSEQNKYINSILYRSLLQYDSSKQKIVGDLTKCDISNLLHIECFLNENIKWSNGENITQDDILKTFEVLKNNNINPIMFSLLKNTTIQKTKTGIVFKNTKKDINFLKIFFQPIVSEKVLNIISKKEMEGNFSLPNGIYSGKYRVVNISKDETIGITTIALEKNNEYYKNPVYIDTILFKVFPDVKTFLRNKGAINIFNDKDNLISGSIPRFKEYEYILPQYVSLFYNTKRITNNDLRALISEKIKPKDLIQELGETNFKKVENPFLSNVYVEKYKSKLSFKSILSEQGFYKKADIINQLQKDLSQIQHTQTFSQEARIKTFSGEAEVAKKTEKKYKIEKIENPKSKTIYSPNWVDTYNFISKPNILLKGKAGNDVEAVYINDYQLQGYTPKSSDFAYRLSLDTKTIKAGDNSYKIFLSRQGKKELIEELHFHYNPDKEALKQIEKETLEKKIPIEEEQPKIEVTQNQPNNSTDITQTPEYKSLFEKINKAQKLDENYYYNKELERYSLELYYLIGKNDHKETAEYIKKILEQEGFYIQLREISTQNLNQLLSEKKKNYDMLLAGVNLSYFDFNIYPYFHSSQIESGYNFSNFRKLDLDIVLEELKSKLLPEEKIQLLEKKALKIIYDNNLSTVIYTPVLSNLVDKNIKSYNLEAEIPESIYRFKPIEKSYVNEEKFVITENKDFIGYIKYLFETLF